MKQQKQEHKIYSLNAKYLAFFVAALLISCVALCFMHFANAEEVDGADANKEVAFVDGVNRSEAYYESEATAVDDAKRADYNGAIDESAIVESENGFTEIDKKALPDNGVGSASEVDVLSDSGKLQTANVENLLKENDDEPIDLNKELEGKSGQVTIAGGDYYLSADLNLYSYDDTSLTLLCIDANLTIDFNGHSIFYEEGDEVSTETKSAIGLFNNDNTAKCEAKFMNSKNTTSTFTIKNKPTSSSVIYFLNYEVFMDNLDFIGYQDEYAEYTCVDVNNEFSQISLDVKVSNCNFNLIPQSIVSFTSGVSTISSCVFKNCNIGIVMTGKGNVSDCIIHTSPTLGFFSSSACFSWVPRIDNDRLVVSKCDMTGEYGLQLFSYDEDRDIPCSASVDASFNTTCDIWFANFVDLEKFQLDVSGSDKISYETLKHPSNPYDEGIFCFKSFDSNLVNRFTPSSNKYWSTVVKDNDNYRLYTCGPRCVVGQPTEANPSVGVSGPDIETCDVTYQWSSVDVEDIIIDEKLGDGQWENDYTAYETPFWVPKVQSSWNTEEEEPSISFLRILDVKKGDTVNIIPSCAENFIGSVTYEAGNDYEEDFGRIVLDKSKGCYTYEAIYDGIFGFTYEQSEPVSTQQTLENMKVKVIVTRLSNENELPGMNEKTLKNPTIGTYRCRVTWTDPQSNGATYSTYSDPVTITHDPTPTPEPEPVVPVSDDSATGASASSTGSTADTSPWALLLTLLAAAGVTASVCRIRQRK